MTPRLNQDELARFGNPERSIGVHPDDGVDICFIDARIPRRIQPRDILPPQRLDLYTSIRCGEIQVHENAISNQTGPVPMTSRVGTEYALHIVRDVKLGGPEEAFMQSIVRPDQNLEYLILPTRRPYTERELDAFAFPLPWIDCT